MINVYSIFKSISGEVGAINQGAWALFIRLAGCNLRCSYCDTARAQENSSGDVLSIVDILKSLDRLDPNGFLPVIITGGEPLSQPIGRLIFHLKGANRRVQIETNGSIPDRHARFETDFICLVMDYKLSGSKMKEQMLPISEFARLNSYHWIKFICTNRKDYEEAKEVMKEIKKLNPLHARFALSACTPGLMIHQLHKWMRDDNLNDTVLNVQIHKLCDLTE